MQDDQPGEAVKDGPGRARGRQMRTDGAATCNAPSSSSDDAWRALVERSRLSPGLWDGSRDLAEVVVRNEYAVQLGGSCGAVAIQTLRDPRMETGVRPSHPPFSRARRARPHDPRGSVAPQGSVWEGGEALARWLCASREHEHEEEGFSPRIAAIGSSLELGAGTGLCSIALGKLGVPAVVATDGDPLACAQIALNAERNGVGGPGGAVHAQRVLWGEREPLQAACAHFAQLGVRGPELVIAADCVYGRSCDELEAVLSLPWYKRQSLLGSTAVDQILNRPVA